MKRWIGTKVVYKTKWKRIGKEEKSSGYKEGSLPLGMNTGRDLGNSGRKSKAILKDKTGNANPNPIDNCERWIGQDRDKRSIRVG